MKKYLSIIVLLLLITMPVKAQINTNSLGLELGKSTMKDVKTILNKKGYKYKYIKNYCEDNVCFALEVTNRIKHEGIKWLEVTFVFNKKTKKLCEIHYLQDEKSLKNNMDILSLSLQLKEDLKNRYKDYIINEHEDFGGELVVYYDDGITSINLHAFENHSMHHPNSYLTLGYELISK